MHRSQVCQGCGALLGTGCPRDKEKRRVGCYLLGGPPARRGFSAPDFEQGKQSEYERVAEANARNRLAEANVIEER